MRIKGDELTIYSVGLESVPKRKEWKIVEKEKKKDFSQPDIEPEKPLSIKLIEKPIIIKPSQIKM